jgi:hypothetical protein
MKDYEDCGTMNPSQEPQTSGAGCIIGQVIAQALAGNSIDQEVVRIESTASSTKQHIQSNIVLVLKLVLCIKVRCLILCS